MKSAYKGTMWCSPGPYLRNSFLKVLARQVSDFFLPEALYAGATFDKEAEDSTRATSQEELLAMSLNLKLEAAREAATKRSREADESDDDDSEDEEGTNN